MSMMWRHGQMGAQQGFAIRRARTPDARAIAEVYVNSWRETYRGQLPDTYLDGLSYEAFERHWRRTFAARGWAFVAEREGRIVGLCSGGKCRREHLAGGEIFVLYVLAAHQGQGVGRGLFDACHYELARRGHSDALVWVLKDNGARRFYERLGGEYAGASEVKIAGTSLPEVAYYWPQ